MRQYWNRQTGEWQDTLPARPRSLLQIIPDIEPYRNVIDGKVIGGRRQHRDFLRAGGYVEVGNERVQSAPPQLDERRLDAAIRKSWGQLYGD